MNHSKFSASNSHRWLQCPASIQVCQNYTNKSSQYAQEGTAMHLLAETCLTEERMASDYLGDIFEGIKMSEEHIDIVQEYLDYIAEIRNDLYELSFMIETRVQYTNWIPKGFGTIDAAVVTEDEIHIIDLKTGRQQVNAENNTQAMLYALGLYQELGYPERLDSFAIHIVQPRLNHFDSWVIDIEALLSFAEEARLKAINALSEHPDFGPSEKACQWCPASHDCIAAAHHHLKEIQLHFDNLEEETLSFPENNQLTTKQFTQLLKAKPAIEKWLADMEAFALKKMLKGEKIEGFKVVEKKTHAKWTSEEFVIDQLGEKAFIQKIVSPAQAKKLAPKIDFSNFIIHPEGEPTIATEEDKRKPYLAFEK